MGELKIKFSGICTHLYCVVPGVPMRSVLPIATGVEFGVLTPAYRPCDEPMFYYLMPHVAKVRDGSGPGAWEHILTGNYIRVTNAKDQQFRRTKGGFKLTDYVKDVNLSADVVFRGRAMAYFDIFGGRVWHEGGADEPSTTHVSISTDGPPEISITPFFDTPLPSTETRIVQDELSVTNMDVYPAGEDSQFDFLKNYLVVAGGLPTQLMKPTPGLGDPTPLTLRRFGERLKGLGVFVETQGTVDGWRNAQAFGDERGNLPLTQLGANPFLGALAPYTIDPVPLDQSCSDSQYP